MNVNGEKKEIFFNDKNKGSESNKSSSSKRKSENGSQSPPKRKKSSERSSTSSKHKFFKEHKNIGSPKYKSSEKTSKKSSSESKSSSTAQKTDEKNKSSNLTSSSSKLKIPKLAKDESSSSKHKSSSSSQNKVSEKLTTNSKSSTEADRKHSENSNSLKKKTSEKSTTDSKFDLATELKLSESSSSKHKSSKPKDKSSDQSSALLSNHKSSSESEKSSSTSSKRSKYSEKSSSSHSKRRKTSDESKSLTKNQTEFIKQEMEKIKEESMKLMAAMFDQIREDAKKVIENVLKSSESLGNNQNSFNIDPEPVCDDQFDTGKDKHSEASKSVCDDCPKKFKYPCSIVPKYYYADRHDLTDVVKRRLVIINASPVENYPDEDYAYICIGGEFVPKCKFDYFVDPMDNILKYRKVADYSHLAESFGDPNIKKTETLNTEILLHEINNLSQIDSNKNVKMVSIKSEKVDDEEDLIKPVHVYSLSKIQPPSDSKENIPISTVKLELQPHCSKKIPPTKMKQELSIDSNEYFRVIPQNSSNSEIPIIEDSKKLNTLTDMSLINKWMAGQNKNHGFKDKEALNFMMSKNSLFSLYKCMGITCCFTTISSSNFLEHLNIHMDENDSIKDCFLNCAYCLDKFTGPTDLIEHYKNFHYNCTYQCNLCFYRAAEQQSVYDHQAYYHSQDSRKREILECPNEFSRDEKIEEQKVTNKIKDIKESLSCECKFFFLSLFLNNFWGIFVIFVINFERRL